MNTIHFLYTDGRQVLRLSKYVPPTPSVDGYFVLAREDKGCTVTVQEFLTNWKVFNANAAFADYLLYTDEHLSNVKYDDTHRHMLMWTKGRCLEIGITLATPINRKDIWQLWEQ